jgi:acyl transferase domain-containing protein
VAKVTAIIGLAGRFPGGSTIEVLWRNLCNGTGPVADAATGSGSEPFTSRVRLFHDCATEAIQDAAYATRIDAQRTGLFTSGGEGDSLAADVAGELGLSGPVVTVESSASPALAAVDRACQSLRSGECDLALAGEVSLRGEGVGVVVLKRLPDALADGDRILAVIRGSAIHEASATGAGAGSPVEGGGLVQALAGVPAETLGYVAAYATGTAAEQGQEIAALDQALRAAARGKDGQAVGSIAADPAAGIAGLLKAVLVVERGLIPPAGATGPFAGNPALREWPDSGGARRALVSALGPRGTAHVVLEQPPAALPQSGHDAANPAESAGEPGPVRERPVLANAYAPPANRLEAAIASVWQEQLGIDRVGVDDNFFELGGTSIVGVKIISLLKEWLHQDIPTVSLYEGPTVSALAKVLLQSGQPKGYDSIRERGERRRRKLQRLGQGARQDVE